MKELNNYILNPKNPIYNFLLGKEYEDLGHSAAAVGFYIRTAEYSSTDLLSYEALLRTALCLSKQGSRVFTVKGTLLRAVSLLPNRPEAYYLLARLYEENKDWQEAYTWACIGYERFELQYYTGDLKTDVEFPGLYGFMFEKAVSAWYIGLYSESLHLFRILDKRTDMFPGHRIAVTNNLINLSDVWQEPMEYDNTMYERLKLKFKRSETIVKNYSQCYQDIFVLTMLNGKKNGTFLEIGCGDPFYGNNTALLEKDFNWSGISIDISKESTNLFTSQRKAVVINDNALKIDYNVILKQRDVDYLQIDVDPAQTSLEVLLKIPFNKHRFAVITFEHDHYLDKTETIKWRSREYLASLGYRLVIGDIAPNRFNSFEDWWIHPSLVNVDIIKNFNILNKPVNKADEVMLIKY